MKKFSIALLVILFLSISTEQVEARGRVRQRARGIAKRVLQPVRRIRQNRPLRTALREIRPFRFLRRG